MIEQIRTYGARLNSALRLIPLAITLSQAGLTGCSVLNTLVTRLHDPLTSQGHGITAADLAVFSHGVQELRSALVSANHPINQLQPGDLQFDARISKLIGIFHKDLPLIKGLLDTFQQLLPVAPTLLGIGTPTNYLIEVVDSTELRPGGGFIGNYGIATLSGGRLSSAQITDVDLLDKPYEIAGHVIPYPAAYTWFDLAPGSWSFRDSNLDANFPTAARYGEQTYKQEGGNVAVQGVIAITPALIEHALSITGPIAIPEYNKTITSSNLIARIHFHQLGGKAAGDRKVWMGYFELTYGETHTITLEWKVPAVASKDRSSLHYQYFIQKQAGILWKLNLQIAVPSCATTTSKWGGFISNNRQEVTLTQILTDDMNLGVDYVCR